MQLLYFTFFCFFSNIYRNRMILCLATDVAICLKNAPDISNSSNWCSCTKKQQHRLRRIDIKHCLRKKDADNHHDK